jgi:hypothetical protein
MNEPEIARKFIDVSESAGEMGTGVSVGTGNWGQCANLDRIAPAVGSRLTSIR